MLTENSIKDHPEFILRRLSRDKQYLVIAEQIKNYVSYTNNLRSPEACSTADKILETFAAADQDAYNDLLELNIKIDDNSKRSLTIVYLIQDLQRADQDVQEFFKAKFDIFNTLEEDEAKREFNTALKNGTLSKDPTATNYINNYMFMGINTTTGKASFKHIATREYLNY